MTRKPLIAVVVALTMLTLTGCNDDTDYECEYVTQLSHIRRQSPAHDAVPAMLSSTEGFLVPKEKK